MAYTDPITGKRKVLNPTINTTLTGVNSTISGGTSPNAPVPPSIKNPASLTPGQSVGTTTAGLSKPMGYEGAVKPIYTPGVSKIDGAGRDIAGTVGPVKPLAPVPTTPAPVQTTPTAQTGTVAPTNNVPGTYKDNGDGTFTQYLSGGQTSTTNAAPINGQQSQAVTDGLDTNIMDNQNNFANMGISEADFNNLPPDVRIKMLEEKQAGVQQSEAIRKMTEQALINERQKQYAQSQESNRLEQEAINANIAGVQSSQRLKDASQNLTNLKQNAGFLGSGGRPVKSQASLDAMGNSLNEAQTTFQIMKNTEDQFAKLRGLQTESQAKQFEENMARLDDQLKQQTTSLFLKAYMEYSDAEKKGLLDTPKKQLEFQQKMLGMVDDSLEGINQAQLAQYGALIEAGKTYAEQTKAQIEREQKLADEQRQNANKIDKDKSEAFGYYVDGNGQKLIDADTGKFIAFDPLKGEKPVITNEGYMISRYTDPITGEIKTDVKRVYKPEVTQADQLDLLLKQTQLAKAQQELQGVQGTISPLVQNIANPQTSIQIADFSQNKRGRENLQCGELVNDYILQATGQEPSTRFGNTLNDKINAVTKLGVASGPVAGGTFVSNPLGNGTGHTGIVTSVNADGSFNVLEANAEGKKEGQAPINKTYKSTEGFTFSQAPAQKTKTEEKQQDVANKEITSLRKEFNALPEVKDYKKVNNYMNTINVNKDKKTPAGDMSLVFAYMKLLDPNSTVREGEYATAKNAGSLEDKVRNAYNGAIKGTILTDKQRNDFASTAREVQKTYEDIYNTRLNEYQSYITEGGDINSIGSEAQQQSNDNPPGAVPSARAKYE